MSNWKHIIADSGGSGTKWAFCGEKGEVDYISSASLHPKFVLGRDSGFWQQLLQFPGPISGEQLYFYGAGCGQESIRQELKTALLKQGFRDVQLFPDTLGACRAVCGNEPGVVAILGTGSVLLEYDGNSIVNRWGGFGSIIGDEGSGFHFARLVLRDYLNGAAAIPELAGILGTTGEIMSRLASPEAQNWIATLAGKLSDVPLGSYHEQNLRAFIDTYFVPIFPQKTQLHIVGSYGFYQREILSTCLNDSGRSIGKVVADPLKELVLFHQNAQN
jgi:hypothetical protein